MYELQNSIRFARWMCCIIINTISARGCDGLKAEKEQRPTTFLWWGHMTMLNACTTAHLQALVAQGISFDFKCIINI